MEQERNNRSTTNGVISQVRSHNISQRYQQQVTGMRESGMQASVSPSNATDGQRQADRRSPPDQMRIQESVLSSVIRNGHQASNRKRPPNNSSICPNFNHRRQVIPNDTNLHEIPIVKTRRPKSDHDAIDIIQPIFKRGNLKVVRGAKQYIFDERGQEYLDCVNGGAHVGHCHPQVVNAAQGQMAKLASAQGMSNDKLSRYVEQLVSTLPDPLSVCYLTNSGSEANDLAIRLARAYTGGYDVISISDGYYGNLGILVDIGSKMHSRVRNHEPKEWAHTIPIPDTYRFSQIEILSGEDPWDFRLREIEKKLSTLVKSGRKIAAMIGEPMNVIPGVYMPPKSFMKGLYRLIRSYGAVVIADEVQTGLGRLGETMWGFQHYELTPDIVTVGKPLGNGHPLGAVLTSMDISNQLGDYYSTYGGNPVSCAVGLAVLDIIHNEKLLSSAAMVGKALLNGLNLLKDKHEVIGDVRGSGLVIAVEIVKTKADQFPYPEMATEIMHGLRCKQIMVAITGQSKNILLITPPMCFNMENSRRLLSALDEVMNEIYTKTKEQSLRTSVIIARSAISDASVGSNSNLASQRQMEDNPERDAEEDDDDSDSDDVLSDQDDGEPHPKHFRMSVSPGNNDNYGDMD